MKSYQVSKSRTLLSVTQLPNYVKHFDKVFLETQVENMVIYTIVYNCTYVTVKYLLHLCPFEQHCFNKCDFYLQDFGNYSCSAENELGKARGVILLSGIISLALFLSLYLSQAALMLAKFGCTGTPHPSVVQTRVVVLQVWVYTINKIKINKSSLGKVCENSRMIITGYF